MKEEEKKENKAVLISGATGLIGVELCEKLKMEKIPIIVLSRDTDRAKDKLPMVDGIIEWTEKTSLSELAKILWQVGSVVNLAGESIAQKWTDENKQRIYDSRIVTTKRLFSAIEQSQFRPKRFISASGINYYGQILKSKDEHVDETEKKGNDFLAKLCNDWEEAALVVEKLNVQVNVCRFGSVLSQKGGFLGKILPAFKWCIGGRLGSGEQYVSWIHIDDAVNGILEIIKGKQFAKFLNFVAPYPVTMSEFARTLGKIDSERQANAVSDALLKGAKEEGERPAHLNIQDLSWIVQDYVDVVVHIFLEEKRKFYNLERLWGDGNFVEINEGSSLVKPVIKRASTNKKEGKMDDFIKKGENTKDVSYDNPNEKKLATSGEGRFGDYSKRMFHFLNSEPFLLFLQKMTGIKEILVPDPYFVGGGFHQIKSGGFLKIHVDFHKHIKLNLDRRLNVLVYLNEDWKEEYGGHFELWENDMSKVVTKVLPVFNRMVVFSTTGSSWHGHPNPLTCPPDRSRKSMALYYYTNGRPDSEVEPDQALRVTTTFVARDGEDSTKMVLFNKFVNTTNDFLPPILLRTAKKIFRKNK
ncbi:hypothetical protein CHS0354_023800 [Potamilus streckersoni]|uniref:TIGR01777 family protein n=1 Tax=Potamilus streckersoni TaxID=2493646 RepID=A0AAE0RYV6_9BIVA|nr:hypothetical protein CHS0354_023800 [Potamilus streckersoni]